MSKKNELKSNGIQFRGFGHYYPQKILSNEEIRTRLKYPEMHPAEEAVIGKEIGVERRFRASEEETAQYMAAEAVKMALQDAKISPEEIDLFILANWTDRYYLPDLAPQASKLVGTKNALSFDVSTACTGFVHGVQTAKMYMLADPKFKKVAVVGSERFSVRVREGGYGEFTAGDAAGAVILEKTDDTSRGLIDSFLFDDADRKHIITCPAPNGLTKSYPDLIPNAIDCTIQAVDMMMEKYGLKPEDIDWMAAHPGTHLVVKGVSEKVCIPKDKQLVNFHYVGNTSAASIPIILSEENQKGRFQKGDLVLTPAVGAGWYWGALLFKI
ncbi:MAG: ketoacyl-ACP synthase III [Leptospiraceae bacterium]|nr:ketoacyl-ACP synthase III [Leptospiraceae bacterium]